MEIHSRGMPLTEDVDMPHLAEITHGFVGADLEALCREAAMVSLRRVLPDIDFSQASIPDSQIARIEVRMSDFFAALREVEPSAIREVFVEVPNVSWKEVGGLSQVKQRLLEAVEWPLQYAHLYEQAATRPPKGILLSGPPGCGKTLLAKAIATESRVNFISVKGPALLSMYVGESEKAVREVFQKARQASPCIVFFDEIDALVPVRAGSSASSNVSERVLSQFLTELDGIEELKGVLVLGATNRLDMLDPAVIRPGRFDEVVEIPLPDLNDREEIFSVHLQKKPLVHKVDYRELARNSERLSGAEIESACNMAALRAVRRAVELLKADPSADVKVLVEAQDIEESLLEVSGSEG
jgi:transitional endoplasmic reticulum ATPase